MKKKLLLMLLCAIALTSCNEDDNVTVTDNEKVLVKKEYFSLTSENFESRTVQYYDGEQIVADSTFNSDGEFVFQTVHSYTANTHTTTGLGPGGQFAGTTASEFDSQGRLSEYTFGGVQRRFTYTGDTILAEQWDEQNQGYLTLSEYTMGENGFIKSQKVLNNVEGELVFTFIFENGRPVEIVGQYNGGVPYNTANYTYYNTTIPVSQQITANKFNYEILRLDQMHVIPQLIFTDLKDVIMGTEVAFHAETTFDPEGYVLQRQTTNVNLEPSGDVHYYYSE